MSKHDEQATKQTTEQLSAYLDGELPPEEAGAVESRLVEDATARHQLEGLRKVVEGLRQTEAPPPPPPTLHHAVARRIALERDRVPFLDRIEASLSPLARHNPLMPMFAVILVLAIAVYSLAVLIERAERADTEVVMVGSTETGATLVGSRTEIAGRVLFWDGELWRERDTPETPRWTVVHGSPEAEAYRDVVPGLADLASLDAPAMVWVEGAAVRFDPSVPNGP